MMKRVSPFVLSAAVLASCSDYQNQSTLNYAHSPSPLLMGTPYGQLELINAGFKNDFGAPLKICVESGKKFIADEELLLETKLAHAMWLKAAGYGEKEFEKFSFELRDKCKIKDTQFASVVVLADKAKEEAEDGYDKQFPQPKITCVSAEKSFSCKDASGSVTVGWGRSATVQHRYFASKPEQWVEVMRKEPAFVLLSQYVEWTNLNEGLVGNEKLTADAKSAIAKSYQELLEAEQQTFVKLISLSDLLRQSNGIMGKDPRFSQLFKDYFKANKSVENEPYNKRLGAFHTLLHEVGHTFGMQHADNPRSDAVTGSSASATQDPVTQQYKTSISSMAYADSYAYLTEDDELGVASAAKEAAKEVAKHK